MLLEVTKLERRKIRDVPMEVVLDLSIWLFNAPMKDIHILEPFAILGHPDNKEVIER